MQGHIDHILRRRIVLRERELIPKGLRPDVDTDFSLGTACPAERWDGLSTPAVQLNSLPVANGLCSQLWGCGPGTQDASFLGSLLGSSSLASIKVDQSQSSENFGVVGMHDFRRCGSSHSSHAGADGSLISSGAVLGWNGGGTCIEVASQSTDMPASLLDMLRSSDGVANSSPHSHGPIPGVGCYSHTDRLQSHAGEFGVDVCAGVWEGVCVGGEFLLPTSLAFMMQERTQTHHAFAPVCMRQISPRHEPPPPLPFLLRQC